MIDLIFFLISLLIILISLILCFLLLYFTVLFFFQSEYYGAPFVDNKLPVIQKAVELLELKKNDIFYDLGSGSGNVILYVSNRYPQFKYAIGIEAALIPYLISKLRIRTFAKNREDLKFIKGDMRKVDISDGTKIYLYLFPDLLKQIAPKLKEVQEKNNARIVSSVFEIPGLKYKSKYKMYHPTFRREKYLYIY